MRRNSLPNWSAERPTAAQLLRHGQQALAEVSAQPALEAQLLLAQVLALPRTRLWSHPETPVAPPALQQYLDLIARRQAEEPLAYVLGEAEFCALILKVNPAVLIPRPETELLVARALTLLDAQPRRVADLGTGSGAIALALAASRPHWRLIATDLSADALALAQENARRLRLAVEFYAGAWCEALPDAAFDLIVSNPPYIAAGDPHLPALRHEPLLALTAGADGLDAIRAIAKQARSHLQRDGWLLLEHGYDQGPAVAELLVELGYEAVTGERDLAGHPRLSFGRWPR
jgi:release factor glutamine methyltransferase